MTRSRRFKVLFSIVFIFLVASLTFLYTAFFKEDAQIVDGEGFVNEDVLGVRNITGVPYIISLPPIVAREGEYYEYRIFAVHKDVRQEDLIIEYVEGPFWLSLKGKVLGGFVPEGSVGTYKIVLRVSDGYNSSTQQEYILVE